MSTPSLQSQAAAVKLAADKALAVAKVIGLRGDRAHLLRQQLEAAAATLAARASDGERRS